MNVIVIYVKIFSKHFCILLERIFGKNFGRNKFKKLDHLIYFIYYHAMYLRIGSIKNILKDNPK